ncbi:SH3 domain-containing protein [Clostridium cadaveris]|uniref:N-acetylmuramoyl-L-alanine amidase n=1 Tax=Clostridium cadaveris TaxID=1529 RepID=UPI001459CD17|nr:N-acetylmuramoyl-L-alanine amidase [Clostridium cadaveris]NME64661.1 SH3 domain-containing protein [Clostridium cadaveris]
MRESIDLGHGVNYDGGAIGRIEEETIINEVGTLVISKLKALGDEVLSVRPSSATSLGNSLSQRCIASNNFNPDIFVSLHANAGGGRGVEIYTYGGKNLEAAQRILDNIVALGFRNRGIKDGSKLYVIRNTIAPAMLIEICFVDTDDVDIYNKVGANAIADAIVKGLKGTTINTNPVETVETSKNKPYEYGVVTASVLNVRDSINGKILGTLPKGATVHIDYVKDGWASIFWGDHGGWICMEYVKPKDLYGVVTATALNVRDGASVNSQILGLKYKGDKVHIGFEQDGWYNIYFGDHGGWVHSKYIRLI